MFPPLSINLNSPSFSFPKKPNIFDLTPLGASFKQSLKRVLLPNFLSPAFGRSLTFFNPLQIIARAFSARLCLLLLQIKISPFFYLQIKQSLPHLGGLLSKIVLFDHSYCYSQSLWLNPI